MNKNKDGLEGLAEAEDQSKNPEFEAFEKNLTEILKVPKEVIDQREKHWRTYSRSGSIGPKNTSNK